MKNNWFIVYLKKRKEGKEVINERKNKQDKTINKKPLMKKYMKENEFKKRRNKQTNKERKENEINYWMRSK